MLICLTSLMNFMVPICFCIYAIRKCQLFVTCMNISVMISNCYHKVITDESTLVQYSTLTQKCIQLIFLVIVMNKTRNEYMFVRHNSYCIQNNNQVGALIFIPLLLYTVYMYIVAPSQKYLPVNL